MRYVTKPRLSIPRVWHDEPYWIDDEPEPTVFNALEVYDNVEATFTGILDERGDPIYRMPNRIGFIWPESLEDVTKAEEEAIEIVIEPIEEPAQKKPRRRRSKASAN